MLFSTGSAGSCVWGSGPAELRATWGAGPVGAEYALIGVPCNIYIYIYMVIYIYIYMRY